jgi:bifunctional lysine-specific demethylase and histidyl-hydroxylase NO66
VTSPLDLLSGDAQTFVDKVWATRVLVHETTPERLTDLLSLDDVDHLLTETAIRTPAVRVARDGSVLPDADFVRSGATVAGRPVTGLVDARKLLALFDDGATVVLQALHRSWPRLAAFTAELELELGHPCQVNAYLTPPGAQGFAVHEDSHDVFVFQTHGTKLWEIHHAEGERPCSVHPDCRVDDVVMRPGVCMYLPTGTPHAARAQESASLHVTLGINQRTWADLLHQALDPLLRSSGTDHLPAGALEHSESLAQQLADRLETLADDLRRLDATEVVDAASERFLTSRPSRLGRGIVAGLAARDLDERTPLRRRPGVPCVRRDRGNRMQLLLGDRTIDVPSWLGPAIDELRPGHTLTPGALPLSAASAVVLCRRLLREGLLEPA